MDSQYHYYVEPGAVGEDPFISLEVGETQEAKTHILRSILSPAKGEKKRDKRKTRHKHTEHGVRHNLDFVNNQIICLRVYAR